MRPAEAMHAGGPPPGVNPMESKSSGFEGREDELGKGVALVIKTLQDAMPYPHEMNDALVKALLTQIQFAKNHGMLDELVAHDIATMAPLLKRIGGMIEKTGQKEMALVGMFDRTTCHYQLALDTVAEPGKRTFTSPYRTVLNASKRIGQFDLTEEEIHNVWTIPRIKGYAAAVGVEVSISDWRDDGVITVELA